MAGEIEVARLVSKLIADTSQFGDAMQGAVKIAAVTSVALTDHIDRIVASIDRIGAQFEQSNKASKETTAEISRGFQGTVPVVTSWGQRFKQAVVDQGLNLAVKAAGKLVQSLKGMVGSIINTVKAGAGLPGIANAFNRNAAQFGVSLEALQKAAAGTVSDFELMKKTNIALTGAGQQLGVEFGKNLPALMAGARAAAAATGQSADFLFQSLVTGVKRSSPLLIDNTGIVLKLGEANEAMARKVGKTVNQLTSEEKSIAILNATVEASQRLIAQTGGAGLTTAEKIAGLGVTIQNFKDQVAVGLNPVLGQVTGILLKLANTVLPPLQDIIVNKIGPGLSVVLDVVEKWVDRFTWAAGASQEFVDNTTEGWMELAPAAENASYTALDKMLNNWADMAAKALTWGAKVVSEFAVGMVQGASNALTAAMNYISGLLGGWLAPGSPPKIMPNLDKWAQGAMNEYLHNMTEADFGILDALQGPMQTALSRLLDAGKISQKQSVELFRGLSEGLAKAASTGEMPTEILDRLRKVTGAYGKDLAALAEKQFALARATKAVKDAEESLENARKAQKDAQNSVADLADEYNRLLAEGADPALLAAKRAEFEAAKNQLAVADDQVTAAEEQKAAADEAIKPLQEQAALQQKILDQMFKMTEPMTLVTDALTAAVGKLKEGLPTEFPTPEFSTEGITTSLGSAFDNAKEQIKGKLQGLFAPVREAWLLEAKPAIAEFQQAWYEFTVRLKLWWYQNGQPIVDAIREFIPEGTFTNMGKFAGKLAVIAVPALLLFGALTLLLNPLTLLAIGIAAIIALAPQAREMFQNLQTLAYTLGYAIGAYLHDKVIQLATDFGTVLHDAMDVVKKFVEEKLTPAFNTFRDTVLQPLIDGVTALWTGLQETVTWFGNLWDKIKEMGGAVWDAIKIFLGHSPSPLEKGLHGIANQMKQMSRTDIPTFGRALSNLPQLSLALEGAMAGGGETNYNYSMEVNTRAETSSVIQDFGMLRYMMPR